MHLLQCALNRLARAEQGPFEIKVYFIDTTDVSGWEYCDVDKCPGPPPTACDGKICSSGHEPTCHVDDSGTCVCDDTGRAPSPTGTCRKKKDASETAAQKASPGELSTSMKVTVGIQLAGFVAALVGLLAMCVSACFVLESKRRCRGKDDEEEEDDDGVNWLHYEEGHDPIYLRKKVLEEEQADGTPAVEAERDEVQENTAAQTESIMYSMMNSIWSAVSGTVRKKDVASEASVSVPSESDWSQSEVTMYTASLRQRLPRTTETETETSTPHSNISDFIE